MPQRRDAMSSLETAAQAWRRRVASAMLAVSVPLLVAWMLLSRADWPSRAPAETAALVVELLPPTPAPPPDVRRAPRPIRQVRDLGGAPAPRGQPVPRSPRIAISSAAPPQRVDVTPVRLDVPAIPPTPPGPGDDRFDAVGGGRDGAGGAGASGSGRGVGAGAGNGGGSADIVTLASWVRRPTETDLAPFVPLGAKSGKVSGNVVLTCLVRRSRRVHDCRLVAESPTGFGFGAASLAASRIFLVHPPRRNGRVLRDARVAIPIEWAYAAPLSAGAALKR